MKVSLAVLADYSNISREGKLNILGIFNLIRAKTFPVIWPYMQLVMTFEAPPSESGTTKNMRVRLMDSDGRQILEIGGQFTLHSRAQGEPMRSNNILNFRNISFPKAGDYDFCILISEEEKARVSLKVIQVQQQ